MERQSAELATSVLSRRGGLVPAPPGWITILRNRLFLRRISGCEFPKFVTRVRPLEYNVAESAQTFCTVS